MDRNSIDTPRKKSSIVIKIAALTLMFVLIFVLKGGAAFTNYFNSNMMDTGRGCVLILRIFMK